MSIPTEANPGAISAKTLEEACKEEINELINASKTFSRYDILVRLRDKLNTKAIVINGLDSFKLRDGSDSFRLGRGDITHILDTLDKDPIMASYKAKYVKDARGRSYKEYSPQIDPAYPTATSLDL